MYGIYLSYKAGLLILFFFPVCPSGSPAHFFLYHFPRLWIFFRAKVCILFAEVCISIRIDHILSCLVHIVCACGLFPRERPLFSAAVVWFPQGSYFNRPVRVRNAVVVLHTFIRLPIICSYVSCFIRPWFPGSKQSATRNGNCLIFCALKLLCNPVLCKAYKRFHCISYHVFSPLSIANISSCMVGSGSGYTGFSARCHVCTIAVSACSQPDS